MSSSILSSFGLPSCSCSTSPDSPVAVKVNLTYKPAEGRFEETGGVGESSGESTPARSQPPNSKTPRSAPMEEPYFSDEVGPAEHNISVSIGMPLIPSLERGSGEAEVVVRAKTPRAPERMNTPSGASLKRAATAETQESSLGGSGSIDGGDEDEDVIDHQDENEKHQDEGGEDARDSNGSIVLLHRESIELPTEHERWAVAAPHVDLSGSWTLIVSDAFKSQYSKYLSNLGFGFMVRSVALQIIGRTTEFTAQSDGGRTLLVRGTNPRGVWERTLTASGAPDLDTRPHRTVGEHYRHLVSPVTTADGEEVEAEAWWEREGTVHRSWLRGGTKYGGGDFESLRYLEDEGRVLVCESVFHPRSRKKRRAEVTWRFRRDNCRSRAKEAAGGVRHICGKTN